MIIDKMASKNGRCPYFSLMLPEGRYQSILSRPSRFIQELSEDTYEQWQIDEGEDWDHLESESEELH